MTDSARISTTNSFRPGADHRAALLDGIPVTEDRQLLNGVSTAVLVGGSGPPVVLLHGPGESAVKWMRIIPDLVRTNRVIAPDLPSHGATAVPSEIDEDTLVAWLDELFELSSQPPLVVGHVLGGALAARHEIRKPGRSAALVLVDTLGLAHFLPAPRFGAGLVRVQMRPNRKNYDRFMRQCSYDLDGLVEEMGGDWELFSGYMLEQARRPEAKAVGTMLRKVGLPRIAPRDLASIEVPTTLIWGRHDRATSVKVAQAASARYGWPLHVIEDCADDPARDRPREFLGALRRAAS